MKRFLSVLTAMILAVSMLCGMSVSVSAADPSIKFSYSTVTVTKGKSATLKPKVSGAGDDYKLVWSSSDKEIATVSSSGKVKGIKEGTVTITAKIKGTSASAGVKVTVGTKVSSVTVDKETISLKAGKKYQIDASVSPSDASNKKLKYSSSKSSVAKVSSSGVITAVKAGTAKITVKATDGTGKKAVITVKVKSAAASSSSASGASNGFRTDMTSEDIVSDMKVGWNLGNSLDVESKGINAETAWGNPKTTQAMIDDIKAAGFNTVRMPVSWSGHVDASGNIDSEWLKRVKQVVNYAYNKDMYVIINSHHDNSLYSIGKCVDNEKQTEKSIKIMTSIWTQVANEFKDYDERLIFETLNEPRAIGSAKEWIGGTAAEREIVYTLNEEIVEAIRATGGNNKYRHIMVPCYAATSNTSVLKTMSLPDDDRIIVSVHAYSPYNYAFNDKSTKSFSDNDKKELAGFFSDLNKIFVSKGIPVVIGEFGAINKGDEADRCKWADYYVSNAGKYNITCVVWDNNSGSKKGNECFGLYDRNKGEWVFPKLVEAIVGAAD